MHPLGRAEPLLACGLPERGPSLDDFRLYKDKAPLVIEFSRVFPRHIGHALFPR